MFNAVMVTTHHNARCGSRFRVTDMLRIDQHTRLVSPVQDLVCFPFQQSMSEGAAPQEYMYNLAHNTIIEKREGEPVRCSGVGDSNRCDKKRIEWTTALDSSVRAQQEARESESGDQFKD